MGPSYRSVRLSLEQTTRKVCKLETTARKHCNRRIFGDLDSLKSIPFPTICSDPPLCTEDNIRFCDRNDGYTMVAHSSVVSGSPRVINRGSFTVAKDVRFSNGPVGGTSPVVSVDKLYSNRLAVIRRRFESVGLSKDTVELLVGSNRQNTNKSYQSAWFKWYNWMVTRNKDPIRPTVNEVLEYLSCLSKKGNAYSTINIARSVISMTSDPVEGINLGTHSLVRRLMKGIYNAFPPRPRYTHFWSVELVLSYISSLGLNEGLSLKMLSLKTAMLLALSTMFRVSEICCIDRSSITFNDSEAKILLSNPRKTQRGTALASVSIKKKRDVVICPVIALANYVSRTEDYLKECNRKNLFISYTRPFAAVKPSTLGNWLKRFLKLAGVNTKVFSAHSTRGATASNDFHAGLTIDSILKAGSWKSKRTFDTFYCKPVLGIWMIAFLLNLFFVYKL